MFRYLQITDWRERWLVGLADLALSVLTAVRRLFGPWRARDGFPQRILVLRLERIGDLLMVLEALADLRAQAPKARIDLVVGSWNTSLARLIPGIDSVESLDVPWMAREVPGESWLALVRNAWSWRSRHYDLAINFESDIRSNLLVGLSGAARRLGYLSGGGGPLFTRALEYDATTHVAENAARLVASAVSESSAQVRGTTEAPRAATRLIVPEHARQRAAKLLAGAEDRGILIGIQPGTGRQIKEWDPVRFASVGAALARGRRVVFLLIGSAGDLKALNTVKANWPADVAMIEVPVDTDLVVLAAVLERLALFITGDTGPMHLAAAVGTPILAIFGPSLPSRYAPLSPKARVVRIDLPCSPCNRLRKPPSRCVGHVPDCLAGIEVPQVLQAADELLGTANRWTLRPLEAAE